MTGTSDLLRPFTQHAERVLYLGTSRWLRSGALRLKPDDIAAESVYSPAIGLSGFDLIVAPKALSVMSDGEIDRWTHRVHERLNLNGLLVITVRPIWYDPLWLVAATPSFDDPTPANRLVDPYSAVRRVMTNGFDVRARRTTWRSSEEAFVFTQTNAGLGHDVSTVAHLDHAAPLSQRTGALLG